MGGTARIIPVKRVEASGQASLVRWRSVTPFRPLSTDRLTLRLWRSCRRAGGLEPPARRRPDVRPGAPRQQRTVQIHPRSDDLTTVRLGAEGQ